MTDADNVIEQKSSRLLTQAIEQQATDIHFVPLEGQYEVYMNIRRKLVKKHSLPPQLANRMILYFKFLSSLDISDKRKPQSGSFHKTISNENYSFRVSSIPAVGFQESIVIRIQRHNNIVPLDELCKHSNWSTILKQAIQKEQGLILISGPTGSGKTTTMYALTAQCAKIHRHIISIEDPVENQHTHLLQIQVNERAGITYSTGLKAILRHSPDVIMLGEIRDAETAKIAVRAALSGHLVITTVHAKDPLGTLYRMLDFGVSLEELRQTIVCISAQRLIMNEHQQLQAVFNIVFNQTLDHIFTALSKGERFYEGSESMESLIEKYRSPKT
ncbi:MAG TPA: competence type IV pilus ATPase ComGA [Sporosarcina sp.]|nr:competence type IV pilus ATPase ComGA [Sporosarcina sp.]